MPPAGRAALPHRPVVVGSGPGGLVAAYFLAAEGYRPLVLERGKAVRERIKDVHAFDRGGPHDPESNYLFGEGGAGTFSDGKLTYRGTGPDVRRVLELFAECKGKPSILYDARPHLGSNRLPAVVKAIRRRIEALGGEVRFSCRVEDLDIADGALRGVMTSSGYIPTTVAILAIGHSARDTYGMLLRRGVPMLAKPFQLGVRIEQPQVGIDRARYGHHRSNTRATRHAAAQTRPRGQYPGAVSWPDISGRPRARAGLSLAMPTLRQPGPRPPPTQRLSALRRRQLLRGRPAAARRRRVPYLR